MLMNAPNSLLTMEGFDTMAMMPMPLAGDGTPDLTPMMPPVIESDHRSEYDLDVYSGYVLVATSSLTSAMVVLFPGEGVC